MTEGPQVGTRRQGQRSVSEKETLTDHQGRVSGDACLATDVLWLDHLRCIIMAQMSLEESSFPCSGVEGGPRAGSE